MEFRFSKEEEAFRQQVRDFLEKEGTDKVTDEIEAGGGYGPYTWDFIRKLGRKGWLIPSWPKKYGGLGVPFTYTYIVCEEMGRRRAFPTLFGPLMVGPTILLYGNEEQKSYYLPRIASGEIEFALGYTEPTAGTDLAAVEMRATETKDGYILNGEKIYSTGAHYAQYHFVLARTNPNVPKHKGLSVFIVDLKTSGITREPLYVLGPPRTNRLYYQDVYVPKSNLVGKKNEGWTYIRTALDYERPAICTIGGLETAFSKLTEYVKQTEYNGKPIYTIATIRDRLAQLAIEIEVARMFSYRVVWMRNSGIIPTYESDMLKLFQTETFQHVFNVAMEITGLYGQLVRGAEWAPHDGYFQNIYRHSIILSVGGGTSEIERNIIARRGLGLPRE